MRDEGISHSPTQRRDAGILVPSPGRVTAALPALELAIIMEYDGTGAKQSQGELDSGYVHAELNVSAKSIQLHYMHDMVIIFQAKQDATGDAGVLSRWRWG